MSFVQHDTTMATELEPRGMSPLWQNVASATFLLFISCVGTIGNFLILYAVGSQKTLRKAKSNYFVCNLALADLAVTAIVLPAAAGNVILDEGRSWLPPPACEVVGFLMPFTCVASMQNLMLISVLRFLGVSSRSNQDEKTEGRVIALLVFLSWIWSALLVLPTLVVDPQSGENLLVFDKAAAMCAWEDVQVPRYSLGLVTVAFCVPLIVSALCYYELFTSVSKRSKAMTERMEGNSARIDTRERKILVTILIVLIVFLFSWGPYCLLLTLDTLGAIDVFTMSAWKRPTAWLGCSNSAFNSIIYGGRNKNFREGYAQCAYHMADVLTCNRYKFYRKRIQARVRRSQANNRIRSTDRGHSTKSITK